MGPRAPRRGFAMFAKEGTLHSGARSVPRVPGTIRLPRQPWEAEGEEERKQGAREFVFN